MKTNIQKTKYNQDGTPDKCEWWTWDEFCDKCGKQTEKVNGFMTTQKPNETKKDYCINCMREMIDNNIKENDNG